MSNLTIRGKDVHRLVTKFQYENSKMSFEILLRIKENSYLVLFLKTNDYGLFRNTFDELMDLRTENGIIHIPQSAGNEAPQGFPAA